jgi:cell shape-determining protein MreC
MPRNKVAWRRLVFVVLIIASLALLTVSFREAEAGPVHAIQQAGLSVLSPLQVWGARAARPFQDGYTWIRTLWSAHNDADRLASELQQLQGEAVKLREQAEENERLKGLLDFQDKGTFPEGTQFSVARVVGKSPTRWEAWIEIDKGSADGIQVDQAVVGATPMTSESLRQGSRGQGGVGDRPHGADPAHHGFRIQRSREDPGAAGRRYRRGLGFGATDHGLCGP